MLLRVVKIQRRQAKVLEIVYTLRPPRGFAGGLDCRQQQCDQDADDRDHHQQLDEREARKEQRVEEQVRGINEIPFSVFPQAREAPNRGGHRGDRLGSEYD